jgi:hypothetical protein
MIASKEPHPPEVEPDRKNDAIPLPAVEVKLYLEYSVASPYNFAVRLLA